MSAPADRLVVIGGSAGALDPLRTVLGCLRPTTTAALVVALHGTGTGLIDLLQANCSLRVRWGHAGALIAPGTVFVAPPDTHIVVRPDRSLAAPQTARRDFYRPSVDWLFESAAATYGQDLLAIVLSGMMSDATAGVKAVRRLEGRVLAQDPACAAQPDMPRAVITSGETTIASPARLAELVDQFVSGNNAPGRPFDRVSQAVIDLAEQRVRLAEAVESLKRTLDVTPHVPPIRS